MRVRQFVDEGLGNSAHLLISESGGAAALIDPLRDVVLSGMTPADRLLAKYSKEWGGDVSHIYEEYSF